MRLERPGGAPRFGLFLTRSLVTLVIPQGYTLSIAGSFAIAAHAYGSPAALDVCGFVVGAVAAFVLLATFVRRNLAGSIVASPMGFGALLNVVPVIVVIGVLGIVELLPWPVTGFPAVGFVAAGGYIVLVSAFFRLVAGPGDSLSRDSSAEATAQHDRDDVAPHSS